MSVDQHAAKGQQAAAGSGEVGSEPVARPESHGPATVPPSAPDVAALIAEAQALGVELKHHKHFGSGHCVHCIGKWPCPSARARTLIPELIAALPARGEPSDPVEAEDAEREQIADLRAEATASRVAAKAEPHQHKKLAHQDNARRCETMASILENVRTHRVSPEDQIATNWTLYQAWRKRAEEAESELAALRATASGEGSVEGEVRWLRTDGQSPMFRAIAVLGGMPTNLPIGARVRVTRAPE